MKEKKDKKRYIIIVLLLLLFISVYFFFLREKSNKDINISDKNTQQIEEDQDSLTPEEVLEQLEGAKDIGSEVKMSITSPEEETFSQGQARMWEAELDGIETEKGLSATCHWEFYLNEYNEEVLYEEMENRSGVSREDPTLCGFTSTFINSKGKLRVKLTADIKNSYGEILETFTAERKYTVL
jgi:preprotein translocase subunit SecF